MISLNLVVSFMAGAVPGFKLGDSVADEYLVGWDENVPKAIKVTSIGLTVLGFYIAGHITKFFPNRKLTQKITNLALQMMLGGLIFICQMLFWINVGEEFRKAATLLERF
jgi:hypothetical protein